MQSLGGGKKNTWWLQGDEMSSVWLEHRGRGEGGADESGEKVGSRIKGPISTWDSLPSSLPVQVPLTPFK